MTRLRVSMLLILTLSATTVFAAPSLLIVSLERATVSRPGQPKRVSLFLG